MSPEVFSTVGLPEARLNLSQAAIYLARAPKSKPNSPQETLRASCRSRLARRSRYDGRP